MAIDINIPTEVSQAIRNGETLFAPSEDVVADALASKQAVLSGTGFVKSTAGVISYDTNTYLTTIAGISAGGELSGTYTNPSLLNSAVIGKVLTGLNLSTGGSILATDSILVAFGRVQNSLSALLGGAIYKGVWNASTNTPTIPAASSGNNGWYYIVNVAGSTNIDGITDWQVGDWIISNGTTWSKVDNTDAVSSVNGFTGAVNLTTANISEVTNLYYTDARSRSSITLTTSGSSGASTYNSGTGALNIPNYTLAGLGGFANPMTTVGDIMYGGASGVATRLAKGTNTWVLRAGATIPEYFNLFGTANSWSATQTINGVEVSSSAIIQNTTTAIYRINNQTGYNRIIGGTTANADPTLTMYASSSGAPNLITYDAQEHRIRLLNSTNLAVFTSTSATFSVPLTLSSITSGSVLFADTAGLVSQDNGKFRYLPTGYNSTAMLMVNATAGSPTPNATLHVEGSSISSSQNVVDFRNSAGTSLFMLKNNNAIMLGNNATFEQGGSGASISFVTNFSRTVQITLDTSVGGSNFGKLRISGGVANTSATTDVAMFALTGTINQTTPVSGVIRGILSNAVLISAYDYKAFTFTHTTAYAPNAAITTYNFSEITPIINASVNSQVINGLNITLTGSNGAFTGVTRNALRLSGGDLNIFTVGNGIKIKEGTNAMSGIVTLVAGVATINTTKVAADSRIQLTRQNASGTIGTSIDVTARTAGTSFTITSNGSILDTSDVAWLIINPS